MLLRLGLLLFCSCVLVCSSQAQISIADVKQLTNAASFDGSQQDLVKLFAKNVRYPVNAQRSNKAGTIVGVIKVDRNGNIVEAGSLNPSIKEFKDEFMRVAQLSKRKWVPSNDTAQFFYAVIPFQFRYQGAEYSLDATQKPDYFQETIVITAIGSNPSLGRVTSDLETEYVSQANQHMKAGRHAESIKNLQDLINLQPFYVGYYNGIIMLYEETGQADKAEYYRAVKETLLASEE